MRRNRRQMTHEKSEQRRRFPMTLAILFALATLSPKSFGQERPLPGPQDPDANATSFAGCYELQLGRWWPWSMGEDTPLVTPPSRIELQARHGTEGFEQNALIIRQIPLGTAFHRNSYWNSRADSVGLTWTDGFAGVRLTLKKRGNELHGWAHAFFDSPRPPHVAYVRARPIGCSLSP
jgi:hypothetical protein